MADLTSGLESAYSRASESPGLALWRVTNAWQRRIRAALAPHDLTHVQFVLLASLAWMNRSEPVTQRDLAAHVRTDVMMTSQVVRALEAKGLLVREPHPTDGRAFTLSPTPAGTTVANRANRDVEGADQAFFNALPSSDRARFTQYLHALDEPGQRSD